MTQEQIDLQKQAVARNDMDTFRWLDRLEKRLDAFQKCERCPKCAGKEALESENARLREALEKISIGEINSMTDGKVLRQIATAALQQTKH